MSEEPPVGRALTVMAPIVTLHSLYSSRHWNEAELRTAVHQAADALNPKPQYTASSALPALGSRVASQRDQPLQLIETCGLHLHSITARAGNLRADKAV
ncbi:hypothetical protein ACFY7H_00690 [Streptomyces sp. NPDC012794]|uniref:hypothetical protein n=1 Tax=Streptomyces sp. NPDC012794 TaxID=3364850 RepID=UPI0036C1209C